MRVNYLYVATLFYLVGSVSTAPCATVAECKGENGTPGDAGFKGNRGGSSFFLLKGSPGNAGSNLQGLRGRPGFSINYTVFNNTDNRDPAIDLVTFQALIAEQGAQGDKGSKGQTANLAVSGNIGFQGETGVTGPNGIKGIGGITGTKGDIGERGATGTISQAVINTINSTVLKTSVSLNNIIDDLKFYSKSWADGGKLTKETLGILADLNPQEESTVRFQLSKVYSISQVKIITDRATSVEKSLTNDILARNTLFQNEKILSIAPRSLSGETVLSDSISGEILRSVNSEKSLTQNILDEKSRAIISEIYLSKSISTGSKLLFDSNIILSIQLSAEISTVRPREMAIASTIAAQNIAVVIFIDNVSKKLSSEIFRSPPKEDVLNLKIVDRNKAAFSEELNLTLYLNKEISKAAIEIDLRDATLTTILAQNDFIAPKSSIALFTEISREKNSISIVNTQLSAFVSLTKSQESSLSSYLSATYQNISTSLNYETMAVTEKISDRKQLELNFHLSLSTANSNSIYQRKNIISMALWQDISTANDFESNLKSKLNALTSKSISTEDSLSGQIDKDFSTMTTSETDALKPRLSTEKYDSYTKNKVQGDQIFLEDSRAKKVELSSADFYYLEQSAAVVSETALSNIINAEYLRASEVMNVLSNQIISEASRANSEEVIEIDTSSIILKSIHSEETTLENAISTEVSRKLALNQKNDRIDFQSIPSYTLINYQTSIEMANIKSNNNFKDYSQELAELITSIQNSEFKLSENASTAFAYNKDEESILTTLSKQYFIIHVSVENSLSLENTEIKAKAIEQESMLLSQYTHIAEQADQTIDQLFIASSSEKIRAESNEKTLHEKLSQRISIDVGRFTLVKTDNSAEIVQASSKENSLLSAISAELKIEEENLADLNNKFNTLAVDSKSQEVHLKGQLQIQIDTAIINEISLSTVLFIHSNEAKNNEMQVSQLLASETSRARDLETKYNNDLSSNIIFHKNIEVSIVQILDIEKGKAMTTENSLSSVLSGEIYMASSEEINLNDTLNGLDIVQTIYTDEMIETMKSKSGLARAGAITLFSDITKAITDTKSLENIIESNFILSKTDRSFKEVFLKDGLINLMTVQNNNNNYIATTIKNANMRNSEFAETLNASLSMKIADSSFQEKILSQLISLEKSTAEFANVVYQNNNAVDAAAFNTLTEINSKFISSHESKFAASSSSLYNSILNESNRAKLNEDQIEVNREKNVFDRTTWEEGFDRVIIKANNDMISRFDSLDVLLAAEKTREAVAISAITATNEMESPRAQSAEASIYTIFLKEPIRAKNQENSIKNAITSDSERVESRHIFIKGVISDEIDRETQKNIIILIEISATKQVAEDTEKQISNMLLLENQRASTSESKLIDSIGGELDRETKAISSVFLSLSSQIFSKNFDENFIKSTFSNEKENARTNENHLAQKNSDEISRFKSKYLQQISNINGEIARAEAKEKNLNTQLTAEILLSSSIELYLSYEISNEIKNTRQAEKNLADQIDSQISTAIKRKNILSIELATEIISASQEETQIKSKLSEHFNSNKQTINNLTLEVNLQKNEVSAAALAILTQLTNEKNEAMSMETILFLKVSQQNLNKLPIETNELIALSTEEFKSELERIILKQKLSTEVFITTPIEIFLSNQLYSETIRARDRESNDSRTLFCEKGYSLNTSETDSSRQCFSILPSFSTGKCPYPFYQFINQSSNENADCVSIIPSVTTCPAIYLLDANAPLGNKNCYSYIPSKSIGNCDKYDTESISYTYAPQGLPSQDCTAIIPSIGISNECNSPYTFDDSKPPSENCFSIIPSISSRQCPNYEPFKYDNTSMNPSEDCVARIPSIGIATTCPVDYIFIEDTFNSNPAKNCVYQEKSIPNEVCPNDYMFIAANDISINCKRVVSSIFNGCPSEYTQILNEPNPNKNCLQEMESITTFQCKEGYKYRDFEGNNAFDDCETISEPYQYSGSFQTCEYTGFYIDSLYFTGIITKDLYQKACKSIQPSFQKCADANDFFNESAVNTEACINYQASERNCSNTDFIYDSSVNYLVACIKYASSYRTCEYPDFGYVYNESADLIDYKNGCVAKTASYRECDKSDYKFEDRFPINEQCKSFKPTSRTCSNLNVFQFNSAVFYTVACTSYLPSERKCDQTPLSYIFSSTAALEKSCQSYANSEEKCALDFSAIYIYNSSASKSNSCKATAASFRSCATPVTHTFNSNNENSKACESFMSIRPENLGFAIELSKKKSSDAEASFTSSIYTELTRATLQEMIISSDLSKNIDRAKQIEENIDHNLSTAEFEWSFRVGGIGMKSLSIDLSKEIDLAPKNAIVLSTALFPLNSVAKYRESSLAQLISIEFFQISQQENLTKNMPSVENYRATSAENSIQVYLTSLLSSSDTLFSTTISNEIYRAKSADYLLSIAHSNEIFRSISKKIDLNSILNDENSRAISGENLIDVKKMTHMTTVAASDARLAKEQNSIIQSNFSMFSNLNNLLISSETQQSSTALITSIEKDRNKAMHESFANLVSSTLSRTSSAIDNNYESVSTQKSTSQRIVEPSLLLAIGKVTTAELTKETNLTLSIFEESDRENIFFLDNANLLFQIDNIRKEDMAAAINKELNIDKVFLFNVQTTQSNIIASTQNSLQISQIIIKDYLSSVVLKQLATAKDIEVLVLGLDTDRAKSAEANLISQLNIQKQISLKSEEFASNIAITEAVRAKNIESYLNSNLNNQKKSALNSENKLLITINDEKIALSISETNILRDISIARANVRVPNEAILTATISSQTNFHTNWQNSIATAVLEINTTSMSEESTAKVKIENLLHHVKVEKSLVTALLIGKDFQIEKEALLSLNISKLSNQVLNANNTLLPSFNLLLSNIDIKSELYTTMSNDSKDSSLALIQLNSKSFSQTSRAISVETSLNSVLSDAFSAEIAIKNLEITTLKTLIDRSIKAEKDVSIYFYVESSLALREERILSNAVTSRAVQISSAQFESKISTEKFIANSSEFTAWSTLIAHSMNSVMSEKSLAAILFADILTAESKETILTDNISLLNANSKSNEISTTSILHLQETKAESIELFILTLGSKKIQEHKNVAETNLTKIIEAFQSLRLDESIINEDLSTQLINSLSKNSKTEENYFALQNQHLSTEFYLAKNIESSNSNEIKNIQLSAQLISSEFLRKTQFKNMFSSDAAKQNEFNIKENVESLNSLVNENSQAVFNENNMLESLNLEIQSSKNIFFSNAIFIQNSKALFSEKSITAMISSLKSSSLTLESDLTRSLKFEMTRELSSYDTLFRIVGAPVGSISPEAQRATDAEDILTTILDNEKKISMDKESKIINDLGIFNINQLDILSTRVNIQKTMSSTQKIVEKSISEILSLNSINNTAKEAIVSMKLKDKITIVNNYESSTTTNLVSALSESKNTFLNLDLNLKTSIKRDFESKDFISSMLSSDIFSSSSALFLNTKNFNNLTDSGKSNEFFDQANLISESSTAVSGEFFLNLKLSSFIDLTLNRVESSFAQNLSLITLKLEQTQIQIEKNLRLESNRAASVENLLERSILTEKSEIISSQIIMIASISDNNTIHLSKEANLNLIMQTIINNHTEKFNLIEDSIINTASLAVQQENSLQNKIKEEYSTLNNFATDFKSKLDDKISVLSNDKQLSIALVSQKQHSTSEKMIITDMLDKVNISRTELLSVKLALTMSTLISNEQDLSINAKITSEKLRAFSAEELISIKNMKTNANITDKINEEELLVSRFLENINISLVIEQNYLSSTNLEEKSSNIMKEKELETLLATIKSSNLNETDIEKKRATSKESIIENTVLKNSSNLMAQISFFATNATNIDANFHAIVDPIYNKLSSDLQNIELVINKGICFSSDVWTLTKTASSTQGNFLTPPIQLCVKNGEKTTLLAKVILLKSDPSKFETSSIQNGSLISISRIDIMQDSGNFSCVFVKFQYESKSSRKREFNVAASVISSLQNEKTIGTNYIIFFNKQLYIQAPNSSQGASSNSENSHGNEIVLLVITFFFHLIWVILLCYRFYQNRESKKTIAKYKKDLLLTIAEATALKSYDQKVQAEAKVIAKRNKAEADLQSQLEKQAQEDIMVRNQLIAKDQQRAKSKNDDILVEDAKEYTIWVVNSALDQWSMEINAMALNYDKNISYSNFGKNPLQTIQAIKSKRNILNYDQLASAIASNIIEEVKLVQPMKYQVHDYNDSSDFFLRFH